MIHGVLTAIIIHGLTGLKIYGIAAILDLLYVHANAITFLDVKD